MATTTQKMYAEKKLSSLERLDRLESWLDRLESWCAAAGPVLVETRQLDLTNRMQFFADAIRALSEVVGAETVAARMQEIVSARNTEIAKGKMLAVEKAVEAGDLIPAELPIQDTSIVVLDNKTAGQIYPAAGSELVPSLRESIKAIGEPVEFEGQTVVCTAVYKAGPTKENA